MFVSCECCQVEVDELITRPQESYRLWCIILYDLENLKNEEAMTRVGSLRHEGGGGLFLYYGYNEHLKIVYIIS